MTYLQRSRSAGWAARWLLRVLVVALVASLLAVAPSAENDAGAQPSVYRQAPVELGIALNQSESLRFGERVSSRHAVHGARALLQATCQRWDDLHRDELITLDENDELVRFGAVNARAEHGPGVVVTIPASEKPDPGYRYTVRYCYTKTKVQQQVQDCPDPYWVWNPATFENDGPFQDPCTTTFVDDWVPSTSYIDKLGPAKHPDAGGWVKTAVDDLKNALENLDPPLNEVWWNSSPGYNSRQVVGLPTFFAAAPIDPSPTGPTTDFTWSTIDWLNNPIAGLGGPVWPDLPESGHEIQLILVIEKQPHSEWNFDDGVSIRCEVPGRLFDPGKDRWLEAGEDVPDDLCLRGWEDTSVQGSSIDRVKLENAQLIYPYVVRSKSIFWPILREFDVVNASASQTPVQGEPVIYKDDLTAEIKGGSKDFVIGEVQTYGVDTDNALLEDQGAELSPWVAPEASTCQKVGFFLPLLGELCKLGALVLKTYVQSVTLVWDGVKLVGTIAKVVLSGLWSLITGCLSAAGELISDLGDTADAVIGAISDPTGTYREVEGTMSLIKEQLANPETRQDFINEVLLQVLGDQLSLEMIATFNKANNEWVINEDNTSDDWLEWTGHVACDVLASLLGKKAAEFITSAKWFERIQDWLTKKKVDIDIPTLKPCTVRKIARGADWASNAVEIYGILSTGVQDELAAESNSFPAGTLVQMAGGTFEPIEALDVGDVIVSYDILSGVWEPQLVLDHWSDIDDGQMASVTLDDGSVITATDGHRFWVESARQWTRLEDVEVGDELLTPQGTAVALAVAEWDPDPVKVYELTVGQNHNYVVSTGGAAVLVHNRCSSGGDNGGGEPANFTQDGDGRVTYDEALDGQPIDGVMLDADGNPIMIRGDGFELVVMADGTVTFIDAGPPPVRRTGGEMSPDGGVIFDNDDGTQTIVDADGDRATIDTTDGFSCNSFPAGTLVLMADGSLEPIEDIEPGDAVRSFDTDTDTWVDANVLSQWWAHDDGILGTVILDDGGQVGATDDHRFWSSSLRAWVELDRLQPGDRLQSPLGEPRVAEIVLRDPDDSIVWELDVDGPDNFTVRAGDHSLVVHNNDSCGVEYDADDDGNRVRTITNPRNGHTSITTTYPDGTTVEVRDTPGNVNTRVEIERNADGKQTHKVQTQADRTITTDYVDSKAGNRQRRVSTEYTSDTTLTNGTHVLAGTTITKKGTATVTTLPDGTQLLEVGSPPTRSVIDPNTGTVDPNNYDPTNVFTEVPDGGVTPPRVSGSTHGVARGPDGEIIHTKSGAGGPANKDFGLDNPTPDVFDSRTHVEGHLAHYMKENGLKEMTVAIDHTGGVCSGCQNNVPAMLPKGGTLNVISPTPDGGVRVQTITKEGVITHEPGSLKYLEITEKANNPAIPLSDDE